MNSDFTAVVWPEDKMPMEAMSYEQCEVFSQGSRIIWGEGDPQAPIVVILDNPGAREDKEGNTYVCETRVNIFRVYTKLQNFKEVSSWILRKLVLQVM